MMRVRNAFPPCVCVVGMHRSGTSAIARVLHTAGWYFGPEQELIAATPDNPTGHFELRLIMDINEDILATFGGSWHTPPHLPADWLRHPHVRALARQAQRDLRRVVDGQARWAWKAPRTCLTLPFWRELLGPMRLVVCFRHPLDVARSLQQRDHMAIERGLQLWHHYNEQLLREVHGHELMVVAYERVVEAPLETCRRLLRFAGGKEALSHAAAAACAIEPQLRHHRTSQHAAARMLPRPVAELYDALVQRSESSEGLAT